jgi:hypothetical protein
LLAAAVILATAGPVHGAVRKTISTADYRFEYTYPDAAARIPAVRAWLDRSRARELAETAQGAAETREEMKRDNYGFAPFRTDITWKVVTDTPRFLSLLGEFYHFSDGAHGNTETADLLWDKEAGRLIHAKAAFTSLRAIDDAVGAPYCRGLKRLRRKRFGDASYDVVGCPGAEELTILLGSTDGRRIDRLGFIADPYVAGAYAEGSYEVTLPVTPAVLQAVRPQYRAAFALGR